MICLVHDNSFVTIIFNTIVKRPLNFEPETFNVLIAIKSIMADGELRNILRRTCLNSTYWNSYRVLYSDGQGCLTIRRHNVDDKIQATVYRHHFYNPS